MARRAGCAGEYQGEFTYYLKSIRDDDTKDAVAVNTTSLYVDAVPPLIAGLEEGGVYCLKASFAVSEKNLAQVLVDGVPQTLAQQSYTLTPGSHTVKAVDLAGNSAIVHVTVNAQHTPGGMIVDAPPTCTGPGSGHTDCTVCGQTAQTGLIIAAPGHAFGPWTVTKQATNVQSGRKERVCTVCGYKETAEIPAFADPASPSAPGSAVSSKKRELLSAQGPKNAFLIYPNAYGWSKIAWGGAAFSLLQVPRHSMQRTETNSKT